MTERDGQLFLQVRRHAARIQFEQIDCAANRFESATAAQRLAELFHDAFTVEIPAALKAGTVSRVQRRVAPHGFPMPLQYLEDRGEHQPPVFRHVRRVLSIAGY